MVQSGFCPKCGDFAELHAEHQDNGRPAYIPFRGPPPTLYCRPCIAEMKREKARQRRAKVRRL